MPASSRTRLRRANRTSVRRLCYSRLYVHFLAAPHPPDAAKSAALSAFDALHRLTAFIFPPAPRQKSSMNQISSPAPPRVSGKRRSNKSSSSQKGQAPYPPLYVQTTGATGGSRTPVVARMACFECKRDDFPNVQGLLNHCRISHRLVISGHDELVSLCGILLSEEESTKLISQGADIKVVNVPSLRHLFERAVAGNADPSSSNSVTDGQAFLSRGLGLHKDSPSLAPYLGKKYRRREIHCDVDYGPVDILDGDEPLPSKVPSFVKSRMYMRLQHENTNPAPESTRSTDKAFEYNDANDTSHLLSLSSESTRFHVRQRFVIADRSFYLSLGRNSSRMKIYSLNVLPKTIDSQNGRTTPINGL